MGEEAHQVFQETVLRRNNGDGAWHNQWATMEDSNIDISESSSMESISEDSSNSVASSEFAEDAASSSSSTSSSSAASYGPLYELSDLMAQLPIKRGLSKHYEGKSQSFASLASVKSLEDLAKKGNPCRRKTMKYCKSYAGGLEYCHRAAYSPKATISKKASKGSLFSSLGKKGGLVGNSCRASSTHLHKKL